MRPAGRGALVRLALIALIGLIGLTGCGLPLSGGVRSAGDVPAAQQRQDPVGIIPPGPQPGDTPSGIVTGFLAAQRSPVDAHGVARSFLAVEERGRWGDEAGVVVYDGDPGATRTLTEVADGDSMRVTVLLRQVGRVLADGSARSQVPTPVSQDYRLRQDPAGQWRLTDVPAGLTLTAGDRDRSFFPASVMFLSPVSGSGGGPHLVPDLVFVSLEGDRATRLVQRLVAGPSAGLASSAVSALPGGARLRSVLTTAPGEVTVDLSGAASLGPGQRRSLSAQLVWTLKLGLPDQFTALRLLADGQPLSIGSDGGVQPRTAWPDDDPDGTSGAVGALAVVRGQAVVEGDGDPEGRRSFARGSRLPASVTGLTGVLDVVADPRTSSLAVLGTGPGGARTLRLATPSGELVTGPSAAGLTSPSWGDGAYGAWVLRTGTGSGPSGRDAPGVLVVAPDGVARRVAVVGLPPLGPASVLRVSRDGARVALVGQDGKLRVGRVEPGRDGAPPRVLDLVVLDEAGTSAVRDVAWTSGTELAVLVKVDVKRAPLEPLVRLSVDGTSRTAQGLQIGLEADTTTVAALGGQLIVGTRTTPAPGAAGRAGAAELLFSGRFGGGFVLLASEASRPRFPG